MIARIASPTLTPRRSASLRSQANMWVGNMIWNRVMCIVYVIRGLVKSEHLLTKAALCIPPKQLLVTPR